MPAAAAASGSWLLPRAPAPVLPAVGDIPLGSGGGPSPRPSLFCLFPCHLRASVAMVLMLPAYLTVLWRKPKHLSMARDPQACPHCPSLCAPCPALPVPCRHAGLLMSPMPNTLPLLGLPRLLLLMAGLVPWVLWTPADPLSKCPQGQASPALWSPQRELSPPCPAVCLVKSIFSS